MYTCEAITMLRITNIISIILKCLSFGNLSCLTYTYLFCLYLAHSPFPGNFVTLDKFAFSKFYRDCTKCTLLFVYLFKLNDYFEISPWGCLFNESFRLIGEQYSIIYNMVIYLSIHILTGIWFISSVG